MNDHFSDDLKHSLGNITDVYMFDLKFEEYKVVDFDLFKGKPHPFFGPEHIIGLNYKVNRNRKNFLLDTDQRYFFNRPDILFSLINLVKTAPPKGYNYPNLDKVICTEKVLKWCKKYGLPFKDDRFFQEFHDNNGQNHYTGFNVYNFKVKVCRLYETYKLWEAIVNKAYNEIIKYSDLIGSFEKDPKSYTQTDKWNLLNEQLSFEIMTHSNIRLGTFYDSESQTFQIKPMAENIIQIAYYQLSCLICIPEWLKAPGSDKKYHIKLCQNCGDYFAGHGHAKYCDKPECDRRLVHRKRSRNGG